MSIDAMGITALFGTLTGLASVAGNLFFKYYEEKNKNEHYKIERKHQIAKETYQKIFNQKMKLYTNLYNIYLDHRKKIQSIGREFCDVDDNGKIYLEQITPQKIFMDTFFKIKSEIEKNIFLISHELDDIFFPMLEAYEKEENNIQNLLHLREISDEEAKIEFEEFSKRLYQNYQNTMNKFWEQLKKEIREIREKNKG